MINGKKFLIFSVLVLVTALLDLNAAEYNEGRIRLVIHESSGRFSLFLLDPEQEKYEPFFTHQDPRTSFLAVYYNDRIFRLGESLRFRTVYDTQDGNPAIIFDSPFLQVRKEFLFIKTSDSPEYNGIKITIKIENKSSAQASVGLRMLIDTSLGEGRGNIPFFAGERAITSETIIKGNSEERFWFSRSDKLSLMGSIRDPDNGRNPDFLHFANWKKLNDAPWKAAYNEGRNFHIPPYSIGDSAVCYYYEPDILKPGENFTCSVFLAEENRTGFGALKKVDTERNVININREADIQRLYALMDLLDSYIGGKIKMSEEELDYLERELYGLKALYGLR